MSNKLAKLESNLPLRAFPEKNLDEVLNTVFKLWLADLLSISGENENKMNLAIGAIKDLFWSLGLSEIKNAFELYAQGRLGIVPKSNYIDIILVGQVFKAYKDFTKSKVKAPMDKEQKEKEMKKEQDDLSVILCFDAFVQDRRVNPNNFWIYTYLEKAIGATDKQKKFYYKLGIDQKMPHAEAVQMAKVKLLVMFFEKIEAKGEHVKKYLQ